MPASQCLAKGAFSNSVAADAAAEHELDKQSQIAVVRKHGLRLHREAEQWADYKKKQASAQRAAAARDAIDLDQQREAQREAIHSRVPSPGGATNVRVPLRFLVFHNWHLAIERPTW